MKHKDQNRASGNLRILLPLVLLCIFSLNAYSQSFGTGYYRLTTEWQGEGKSLDVVNDGTNNKLQMAKTADVSGQSWKITPAGDGYFRLSTEWQSEGKSLDVINDGTNNKLQLAKTANVTGQYWKITPVGDGYYRLTTKWQGDGKSLDVVNDGSKPQLAKTDNVPGQMWRISKVFKRMSLALFQIRYDATRSEEAEFKEMLAILKVKLTELFRILPIKIFPKLTRHYIWIEYIKDPGGAAVHHPDKTWLLKNGYPAEMENSVEITNIRNFIDWQDHQPYMVLHEFAHALRVGLAPDLQAILIAAYNAAKASGKYDSVDYIRGGKQKAYAMTDEKEYFAELSEAYFGKNDFYPFTKQELEKFDPEGYKLMQEAWR